MSAPAIQTHEEFTARVRPLRVENGRVADGPYIGAAATRDQRWDCCGRRCFKLDGYWVHEPVCEYEHHQPVPTGNPSPLAARQINDAELRASGHMDPVPWNGGADVELMARQALVGRGAE